MEQIRQASFRNPRVPRPGLSLSRKETSEFHLFWFSHSLAWESVRIAMLLVDRIRRMKVLTTGDLLEEAINVVRSFREFALWAPKGSSGKTPYAMLSIALRRLLVFFKRNKKCSRRQCTKYMSLQIPCNSILRMEVTRGPSKLRPAPKTQH